MRPKCSSAVSIISRTSVALLTSTRSARARAPSAAAVSSALSRSRSAISTCAPSATNLAQMPAPKPDAPPVTMATLFFSLMGCLLPVRQSCLMATVFSDEKPYSASKPFSRPWPECLTPPNGSSMPPPAP